MWVILEPQKALQAGVPGEGGFRRCELGPPWMHHLPSPAGPCSLALLLLSPWMASADPLPLDSSPLVLGRKVWVALRGSPLERPDLTSKVALSIWTRRSVSV